ncbi:methylated-DNA--[protein]-cysteine S-methyltransferase [Desulfospira joergensenii]|uniref:methylated-DNA--[protein]-cysteine S-methyltransferase n=1 Tax=Desulfospira joergensenii TaxID=53329 RepID=UPI0003B524DB|nr:methylated-DNA--[protein]-cysteine S-methyltransferase [Desulfospira joergensenii]
MNKIRYAYFESPLGRLLLTGQDRLQSLHFPKGTTRKEPGKEWVPDPEGFKDVLEQLEAYFQGELKTFALDLDPQGTPFQEKVWKELVKIPFGETLSYGELAHRIGNPKASRAVGMANGKNPIAIIIPCHRVIGKDGSLTGFGGGLDIKAGLLEFERANL